MLFKAIFRHCNCFLSSVAKDGKDGDGLRLETVGPTFSSFNAISAKLTPKNIMFHTPWWNLFDYLLHNSTGESSTRWRRFYSGSLLFAPLLPIKNQKPKQNKETNKKDIFSFCGLLGAFTALWGGTDFRTLPTSRPRPQVSSLPLSLIDTLGTRLFHCEEIKFFNRFYCDYSIIFFKCERIYHMTKLVPWWFRSS